MDGEGVQPPFLRMRTTWVGGNGFYEGPHASMVELPPSRSMNAPASAKARDGVFEIDTWNSIDKGYTIRPTC